MRSPLTETIRRVEGMIAYVRENLDEGEYDLFLDLVLPEPEPVKTVKKGRKKGSKGGSKSPRASGMAAAINRSLSQGRQAAALNDDTDNDPNEHCQKELAGGFFCNEPADANVHHLRGATGYHEFDAGKSLTSAAPLARAKSSTNGGATSGTVSSEADRENVSTATGG